MVLWEKIPEDKDVGLLFSVAFSFFLLSVFSSCSSILTVLFLLSSLSFHLPVITHGIISSSIPFPIPIHMHSTHAPPTCHTSAIGVQVFRGGGLSPGPGGSPQLSQEPGGLT